MNDATGAAEVLHGLPDGSFSRDDAVAREEARLACEALKATDDSVQATPGGQPAADPYKVARWVACSRLWSVPASALEAQLRAHLPNVPKDSASGELVVDEKVSTGARIEPPSRSRSPARLDTDDAELAGASARHANALRACQGGGGGGGGASHLPVAGSDALGPFLSQAGALPPQREEREHAEHRCGSIRSLSGGLRAAAVGGGDTGAASSRRAARVVTAARAARPAPGAAASRAAPAARGASAARRAGAAAAAGLGTRTRLPCRCRRSRWCHRAGSRRSTSRRRGTCCPPGTRWACTCSSSLRTRRSCTRVVVRARVAVVARGAVGLVPEGARPVAVARAARVARVGGARVARPCARAVRACVVVRARVAVVAREAVGLVAPLWSSTSTGCRAGRRRSGSRRSARRRRRHFPQPVLQAPPWQAPPEHAVPSGAFPKEQVPSPLQVPPVWHAVGVHVCSSSLRNWRSCTRRSSCRGFRRCRRCRWSCFTWSMLGLRAGE